jgi:hypothetical protein
MTGEQALDNMAQDLDELERRKTVSPAYIRRKREELDAIRAELSAGKGHAAQLQAELERAAINHAEDAARVGMLANVLTILGLSPFGHLKRPVSDAPIYQRAAELISQQRKQPNAKGILREPWTFTARVELLTNALYMARLDIRLRPFMNLLHRTEHEQ